MYSSRLFSLSLLSLYISLLSSPLLIQIGLADRLIFSNTGDETFLPGDAYAEDLSMVFDQLKISIQTFFFRSCQRGVVYGLAHCRGDLNTTDCIQCIGQAIKTAQQMYPHSKNVQLIFNRCLLKYSNEYFFTEIDTNWYVRNGTQSLSSYPNFSSVYRELFKRVAERDFDSQGMYGCGYEFLPSDSVLYGLVECRLDLTVANCTECIRLASEFGKQKGILTEYGGGQVASTTCGYRFELYPFYKS